MVREIILQGQGKVREFYFESGKIEIISHGCFNTFEG